MEYLTYKERLESFKNWPFKGNANCTSEKMAQTGFYFIGRGCVKCYYCDKELDNWEPEDVPFEEHKKHSRNCPFMKMFSLPPKTLTVGQVFQLQHDKNCYILDKALEKYKEMATLEYNKDVEAIKKMCYK